MYITREEAIQNNTEYPENATYDELYIGALVECPDRYDYQTKFKGKIGTIVDIYLKGTSRLVSVSWENWQDGHGGGFDIPKKTNDSSCWNSDLRGCNLILIDTISKDRDPEEIFSLLD